MPILVLLMLKVETVFKLSYNGRLLETTSAVAALAVVPRATSLGIPAILSIPLGLEKNAGLNGALDEFFAA